MDTLGISNESRNIVDSPCVRSAWLYVGFHDPTIRMLSVTTTRLASTDKSECSEVYCPRLVSAVHARNTVGNKFGNVRL